MAESTQSGSKEQATDAGRAGDTASAATEVGAGATKPYRPPSADRKPRRVERNLAIDQLVNYRLPLAGIVSILHRASGALLVLVGIPFVLYLFQKSITSELSFQVYRGVVGSFGGKLVLIVLIWAFLHHLIAGIRYLVLDLHIGVDKEMADLSSKIVLGASLALTLICAIALLFA